MNIQQMMKQAQALQKKMLELQEENSKKEYTGQAGGGLVKISINGKYDIQDINIDPSILTADDSEMLRDLIIAAFKEAKKKAEDDNNDNISSSFGGMLPPGFKFPF
jgi:DNA-binding YbaB/EbfC family protein